MKKIVLLFIGLLFLIGCAQKQTTTGPDTTGIKQSIEREFSVEGRIFDSLGKPVAYVPIDWHIQWEVKGETFDQTILLYTDYEGNFQKTLKTTQYTSGTMLGSGAYYYVLGYITLYRDEITYNYFSKSDLAYLEANKTFVVKPLYLWNKPNARFDVLTGVGVVLTWNPWEIYKYVDTDVQYDFWRDREPTTTPDGSVKNRTATKANQIFDASLSFYCYLGAYAEKNDWTALIGPIKYKPQ